MRWLALTLLSAVVLVTTSCAAAAGWSMQAPPEPAGADDSHPYDFSCDRDPQSTNHCTAAGVSVDGGVETPLLARWEGGRWALQAAVIPRDAVESRFQGITCPSETVCVAAGSYTTATNEVSLAERWNGTSWSVQRTVDPAGATTTKLHDVSCWISSTCTAVGYAVVGSVRSAIAQRWDGSTWTLQSIPLPAGALASQFNAVTCRSNTFCVAVGSYVDRSGRVTGLGAFWDGTSWSAPAIPSPAGIGGEYLTGVSCLDSDTCIAVGTDTEIGTARTLTLHGSGRAWTLVPSPNPAGSYSELRGVSCVRLSLCAAVGLTVAPSGDVRTLALRWNGSEWGTGTAWELDDSPSLVGSPFGTLDAVVCDAATCMGTGYADVGGGTYRPLAARDDGAPGWIKKTLPTPVSGEFLRDITCFVANGCFAVGVGAGNARMFIGGTGSWSFYGQLSPVGAVSSDLRGVDCVTGPFFCATVGVYRASGGPEMPYAFTDIDSGGWDPRTVPTPGGASAALNEVSCASPSACMAVGDFKQAGVPKGFTSYWNGSVWSTRTAQNAPSSTTNYMNSVSCLSASDCIAVGDASVSGIFQPVVQRWNGTSWTLHTSPLPGGALGGSLLGVSCAASSCMAVGVAGVQPYVVRWNGVGTTWTVDAAPLPAFATGARVEDVACTSATACMAVGTYTLPSGARASFAASWDGTAWTNQVTPNPGTSTNVLLGVSCVSATVCRTAGYANSGSGTFNLVATLN